MYLRAWVPYAEVIYPLALNTGGRQCPLQGADVGLSYHWTVEIVSVDGVPYWTTGTAVPTPTNTPWPTPTPYDTPDPFRCMAYDWAGDTPPIADVGFDDDLVEEGDCYTLIPGLHIELPGIDILGFDGAEIEWDQYTACVNWVRFPNVSLFGLTISLDWFLVPAVAWLLKRVIHR